MTWNAKNITNILAALIVIGILVYFFGFNSSNESADNDSTPESEPSQEYSLEDYEGYGVSSSNQQAIDTGMEILDQGGNAVDAAVAVSFTLGVTEPFGSGIGGGGGMMYMGSAEDVPTYYDYRETASSTNPADQIGIPGFVKGMQTVHEQHGSLPIEDLLQPAIDYAENGFEVDKTLADRLYYATPRITTSAAPSFYPDGESIKEGETLTQPELAQTLRTLQENGLDDFYEGEIANQISESVAHIEPADLQNYTVAETEAAAGEFEGSTVYSAAPPLSGITVIQMLGMAEYLNVEDTMGDEAEYVRLVSEITRQAYFNRLNRLGDPAFEDVDVELLTGDTYIENRADFVQESRLDNVTALDEYDGVEHTSTSHFVIMDDEGRTISATNTLGNFFGSGSNIDGAWMNSQLGNYSDDPESPNYLVEGKRPRSFMAPTIIQGENNSSVMGVGSPGGDRIPSAIVEFLLRQAYTDESVQDSVNHGRFHPQIDTIHIEERMANDQLIEDLQNYGYQTEVETVATYFGNITGLVRNNEEETMEGISDARRAGSYDIN
ncbi:gamma-glutamyltranspeptidase/glutathione hydrolase [Sinobaca qinghaiensis]|uniref:Gamma-glutamyltranspeptidase/glutathione hydrolase n=1 Tax=Sinobaca qinghaiensis TaxID=342944 RepID=A0A419UX91_9BACL|nr:gamma-glutamyltransferase [Sinobaca qinghaiensis]RKD69762.1 gamma-glutamyltranspeptidase/glutathione hydrolase [Sinobaca qinghaiensis]